MIESLWDLLPVDLEIEIDNYCYFYEKTFDGYVKVWGIKKFSGFVYHRGYDLPAKIYPDGTKRILFIW